MGLQDRGWRGCSFWEEVLAGITVPLLSFLPFQTVYMDELLEVVWVSP